MDDDSDSFFNHSGINFADDDEEDFAGHNGKLYVTLLGADVEESGILTGVLRIYAAKGMKEGSILLRVETEEETVINHKKILEENTFESSLNSQIQGMRNASKKFSATSPNQNRKGLLALNFSRKLNQLYAMFEDSEKRASELSKVKVAHSSKSSWKTSTSMKNYPRVSNYYSKNGAPKSKDVIKANAVQHKSIIKYENFEKQQTRRLGFAEPSVKEGSVASGEAELRTNIRQYIAFDYEVFKFEYSFSKAASMLLDFRIAMKRNLLQSYNYNFNFTDIGKACTTINSYASNTGDAQEKFNLGKEREKIRISHKLTFYYVTTAALKTFPKDPVTKQFPMDNLKASLGFLASKSTCFSIQPPLKQFETSKPLDKTSEVRAETSKHAWMCCKSHQVYKINIHYDSTRIGHSDSNLTIVVNFKRGLEKTLPFLDMMLHCKIVRTSNEDQSYEQYYVLKKHHINIQHRLPKQAIRPYEELIERISVSEVRHLLQTVSTPSTSIRYFVTLYLSDFPYGFKQKIDQQEFIFSSVDKDFYILPEAEVQRTLSRYHEDLDPNLIWLPFTPIELGVEYKNKEQEQDDKENMPTNYLLKNVKFDDDSIFPTVFHNNPETESAEKLQATSKEIVHS